MALRAITQAKHAFYLERVKNLKSFDPASWHRGVQQIANRLKPQLTISSRSVSAKDEVTIAEMINQQFVQITKSQPAIDLSKLPMYLPARQPPQVTEWDVYRELLKIKIGKAAGPDNIPNKIIKEFACELSIPVTDIFNSSLRTGIVPQAWKDAVVAPSLRNSLLR